MADNQENTSSAPESGTRESTNNGPAGASPQGAQGSGFEAAPESGTRVQSPDAGQSGLQQQADPSIASAPESGTKPEPAYVPFADFARLDIRVAQITSASRIEKADKLLVLQVDLGALGSRQVVAGIAKHYQPEGLIGRKIVVITNLQPVKLRGHESQGMLLAASDDAGNLELLSPGDALAPGSIVR